MPAFFTEEPGTSHARITAQRLLPSLPFLAFLAFLTSHDAA
jgi:hypothetical protein